MTARERYRPGPADQASIRQDGENWTLVLVRQLRHSPEAVWSALTEPAQLREWAPFDADGNMGIAGSQVTLSTVGTATPSISEVTIERAVRPGSSSTAGAMEICAGNSRNATAARASPSGTASIAATSPWARPAGTSAWTSWITHSAARRSAGSPARRP